MALLSWICRTQHSVCHKRSEFLTSLLSSTNHMFFCSYSKLLHYFNHVCPHSKLNAHQTMLPKTYQRPNSIPVRHVFSPKGMKPQSHCLGFVVSLWKSFSVWELRPKKSVKLRQRHNNLRLPLQKKAAENAGWIDHRVAQVVEPEGKWVNTWAMRPTQSGNNTQ